MAKSAEFWAEVAGHAKRGRSRVDVAKRMGYTNPRGFYELLWRNPDKDPFPNHRVIERHPLPLAEMVKLFIKMGFSKQKAAKAIGYRDTPRFDKQLRKYNLEYPTT